ncbi:MAG: S8 family peptidase, partial [Limisphaerales bacterium]
MPNIDDSNRFDPNNLVKTVIAVPLLKEIEADPDALRYVIIDSNVRYTEGRHRAKDLILQFIEDAIKAAGDANAKQGANRSKSEASQQYVYARLQGKVIRALITRDQQNDTRAIFHVWPDFIVRAQMWKSVPAVKADACRRAFDTSGKGILWAIIDSGVDATHPHFSKF